MSDSDLVDDRKQKKARTNEKDFVRDGLTTVQIRDTVKSIREYISNNKDNLSHDKIVENLQNQYSFFFKRYPMLFSLATNKNDFDFESLEYFLNKRDDIIKNVMTSEEASKQIGQEWFNKYVDISKLPQK